jgi:hypothetical protein
MITPALFNQRVNYQEMLDFYQHQTSPIHALGNAISDSTTTLKQAGQTSAVHAITPPAKQQHEETMRSHGVARQYKCFGMESCNSDEACIFRVVGIEGMHMSRALGL